MLLSKRSWSLALATLFGAGALAAACGPPPSPPPPSGGPTADPVSTEAPSTSTSAAPTASASSSATSTPSTEASADPSGKPFLACRLPEAKKSGDKCKADADCGLSDPCHAHACVAASKAHPPDKTTVCTRLMDCQSSDANSCGCFEGVCSLVPGK